MHIIRTIHALRQALKLHSEGGSKKVALIPTMGALHDGHLSLIRQGKRLADIVVASIFVNPRQFAPGEDFAAYPRPEAEDIEKLSQNQVDIAYIPTGQEMYGEGFSTHISVRGISEGLCGGKRPGHFDGVALIVTKLLLQVLPDIAIFGEKDYQQLLVIKRLVADLDIPVDIMAGPILREQDGLAMSSRNLYLNAKERTIAPALYRQLTTIATLLSSKEDVEIAPLLAKAKEALLAEGFTSVDYIELRDARTLAPVTKPTQPARLLAAAYLGRCRLIDNVPVFLS